MDKDTTDELRRIIHRCCEIAEAADKVAIRAIKATASEGTKRTAQIRDLRARVSVLERHWRELMRQGRVR